MKKINILLCSLMSLSSSVMAQSAVDAVKQKSIAAGALGCGISGSGPSIFALCKGEATAIKVAETMMKVYENVGIDYDIHVSKVNNQGIKILN